MLSPQLIGNLLTSDSLVAQNGNMSQGSRSQHDVNKTESHLQPPVGAVIEEVSKCQNKVFLKLQTVRLRECSDQSVRTKKAIVLSPLLIEESFSILTLRVPSPGITEG